MSETTKAYRANDDAALPAFMDLLRNQRRGELLAEASEKLVEVVEAVRDTGKGGSVTITFTIKPDDTARNTFKVSDDVRAKVPQFSRGVSLYFANHQGRLVREDPRQPTLPFTGGTK